ncbi:unnamed protein product [Ascophyllum nodosum]
MKRSSRVAFFLALVNQSFAFCPAVTGDLLSFSSNPILVTGTGNSMSGGFACDVLSRCPRGSTGQSSRWRRQGSRKRSIALSGVGSIMSPPPPTLATGRGGGGEDGMRELTRQEGEEAAALLAANAKTHLGGQPDYNDFMESIDGVQEWLRALGKKRVGCRRMVLGSFKRGKLLSIVAAEVVWSTGSLSRDVRICSRLIVVNPAYDKRAVGFATVDQLKSFGRQNALLLDLSPMMAVPSCRIFCLASTQTLEEDPERLFQASCTRPMDPLVQQFNSRVRRCCYVLDDIPEGADLGPYWYEGTLPRRVRFFFRKKFHAVNEFEVTLQWPGAGLATGSGTVGGARVIPMEEAEAAKDIPGHSMIREIERRLSNRLLAEMQGENPVLND